MHRSGYVPETVVHLYRAGGIWKPQALQGATHSIKLALNQNGIAPVLIPAISHCISPGLPISAASSLVVLRHSTRRKLAEVCQQFGFGCLQLLKLFQILDSQSLKLEVQHLRKLFCKLLGLPDA